MKSFMALVFLSLILGAVIVQAVDNQNKGNNGKAAVNGSPKASAGNHSVAGHSEKDRFIPGGNKTAHGNHGFGRPWANGTNFGIFSRRNHSGFQWAGNGSFPHHNFNFSHGNHSFGNHSKHDWSHFKGNFSAWANFSRGNHSIRGFPFMMSNRSFPAWFNASMRNHSNHGDHGNEKNQRTPAGHLKPGQGVNGTVVSADSKSKAHAGQNNSQQGRNNNEKPQDNRASKNGTAANNGKGHNGKR